MAGKPILNRRHLIISVEFQLLKFRFAIIDANRTELEKNCD